MTARYESIIANTVCRVMVPFMQVFAIYVVMHGHYTPGGGFQGGVILAASIALLRLTLGKERSHQKFPPKLATSLGTVGVLIFAGTGVLSFATGGAFLDYGYLTIPGISGAELRYLGILMVELGIALAVMGILISIFDRLIEGGDNV
jgi:multicomponent Na+:H+ antiporter subunit B